MPVFACPQDLAFMESINKEMYELYLHKIPVYKLNFRTPTKNDVYHEDVNRDIKDVPTYYCEAYMNVSDNGIAALYKQGQQLDRQLWVYMSRKKLEDVLTLGGFDKYRDVPTDGDIVKIQGLLWEVMTVDPEGYHMNAANAPFDFQFNVVPWVRSAIPKDATYEEVKRF